MSRNRFLIILRALPISRNIDSKPDDWLYKIRPVINYFNERMDLYPSLLLPRSRTFVGRVYGSLEREINFSAVHKKQKNKYGIKLYMLTDPKGMVLKFMVYSGTLGDFGGKGHTEKVVMHLLEG